MPDPVAAPELAASLKAGLATLSGNGSVVFTRYVRVVLPLDGFVFWVRSDIAPPVAALGQPTPATLAPVTLTVSGSLHYATMKAQGEDETVSTNQVVFTASAEVNDLNAVTPGVMWIARVGDEAIPYAFSARGRFFKQADLYHYTGDAVTPALRTQIIDDPAALLALDVVVSNSLPAWLALNTYRPPYPGFFTKITLYPSFAVPENLPPPYGAVHIEPSSTAALGSAPAFGPSLSQQQLARDRVRITLVGLGNDAAADFLAAVYQYSADYSLIGLSGMPSPIRDEKRTHRELGILAMRKTVEVEVNYLQGSMRDLARQLIASVAANYQPTNVVPIG